MNSTILELAAGLGLSQNTLKKFRQRGKVPFKHRLPILEAAQKKGIRLTSRDFDGAPAPRPKKRAERRAPA